MSKLDEKLLEAIKKSLNESLSFSYSHIPVSEEQVLKCILRSHQLNEEYHIVNTFVECSQDIIKNLMKYETDTEIYTGWVFDRENVKCLNIDYICNDRYLPIFVKAVNDEKYVNYMSITDRNKNSDKISITINIAKIR